MQPRHRSNYWFSSLTCLLAAIAGCTQPPPPLDSDVIIVGAGIAGLSAALEASKQGARVLVIEANSVGGGHAVKAGGFALVDTDLQRSKGLKDSPNTAFLDFMGWGETTDPYWARYYAEHSGPDVYDWLTAAGVEFVVVIDTPEDTVPRFHFTRGTAVNAVIPLMRKALLDPNIQFVWNTRVTALARTRGAITGVQGVNERTSEKRLYQATSVVLATGGFQNNLEEVRANWPDDRPLPKQLLKGAGQYATGDGYKLAAWAGADLQRMDRQVTFYNGIPNPRDATGTTALVTQNPSAIWVAADGRRFINESVDSKQVEAAVNQLPDGRYWLIFDANGSRRFGVRGAPWLNRDTVRAEILDNPMLTAQADTIEELAVKAGMPAHGLSTSVQVWNRMVDVGADFQFQRFSTDNKTRGIQALSKAPYYAVRMYPLTRKSMGGPAINAEAQVQDKNKQSIPGLFAAGELTGVAGINGSHGGSGTFLGPSVLTGRIAGKAAAARANKVVRKGPGYSVDAQTKNVFSPAPESGGLPGYWHFDVAHALVRERDYSCDTCHNETVPMHTADTRAAMLARLNTCTLCH